MIALGDFGLSHLRTETGLHPRRSSTSGRPSAGPSVPPAGPRPLPRGRRRWAPGEEDMVPPQGDNLLAPMAPTPSVETFLHASLPQKFVHHPHSPAVLTLIALNTTQITSST